MSILTAIISHKKLDKTAFQSLSPESILAEVTAVMTLGKIIDDTTTAHIEEGVFKVDIAREEGGAEAGASAQEHYDKLVAAIGPLREDMVTRLKQFQMSPTANTAYNYCAAVAAVYEKGYKWSSYFSPHNRFSDDVMNAFEYSRCD